MQLQAATSRRRRVCIAAAIVWLSATCNGSDRSSAPAAGTDRATSAHATAVANSGIIAADTAERTLAVAAGIALYHVDAALPDVGSMTGSITHDGALPLDTMVSPNADSTNCRPFFDRTFPDQRGVNGSAVKPAVGNAVVWLVGMTHGLRDESPRRVELELAHCQLSPRVQRAPMGATINVISHDKLLANLQFADLNATPIRLRTKVGFTDPGQVVPTSVALAAAGLVEVRDAAHSWIRAYVAVAPHPFVAVTSVDGKFSFEGVPVGTYQLVVWHERLGARVVTVKIERGAAVNADVVYADEKKR